MITAIIVGTSYMVIDYTINIDSLFIFILNLLFGFDIDDIATINKNKNFNTEQFKERTSRSRQMKVLKDINNIMVPSTDLYFPDGSFYNKYETFIRRNYHMVLQEWKSNFNSLNKKGFLSTGVSLDKKVFIEEIKKNGFFYKSEFNEPVKVNVNVEAQKKEIEEVLLKFEKRRNLKQKFKVLLQVGLLGSLWLMATDVAEIIYKFLFK